MATQAQAPPLNTPETGTAAQEWARRTANAAFGLSSPTEPQLNATQTASSPQVSPESTSGLASHPQLGDLSISAAKDAQKGAFDPTFVAVRSPAFDAHIPGAYPETPRGETAGAGGVSMSEGAPTTASTFTQPATALAAGSVPKGVVDTVPFDTRESTPPISVSVPASFPRN